MNSEEHCKHFLFFWLFYGEKRHPVAYKNGKLCGSGKIIATQWPPQLAMMICWKAFAVYIWLAAEWQPYQWIACADEFVSEIIFAQR